AYLLGMLPTATIVTVARRVVARWVNLGDSDPHALTDIQKLHSVDVYTAELLADEGITSAAELAYADPVRLSIRTGLGFSVVITCASEAMLALYLTEPDQMPKARRYGIGGSYEVADVWRA